MDATRPFWHECRGRGRGLLRGVTSRRAAVSVLLRVLGDVQGRHLDELSRVRRGPEALREQTRATTDWVVDSTDLSVVERDDWAAFNDAVTLAWTSTDDEERHEYETRWSGTLEAHGDEWLFLELHVSSARSL